MSKQIKFSTKDLPVHNCDLCERPIRTPEMIKVGNKYYHPGEFKSQFKKVATRPSRRIRITKKESSKWAKFLLGAGIIYAITLILFAGQIKI